MELDFCRPIAAALLGGCVFMFWFLKRVNEWYYVGRLGEAACPLPPGDMGWPFIGNMLSLFKSLRSGEPNAYLYGLISRYGKTGIYKTHVFGCPSIIVCTPELCRHVLTNDEHFKQGYPKSCDLLSGKKSLSKITRAEHKRMRQLIAAPINGHEALAIYIEHIESTVISSLDEWANKKHPFELFTEMKRVTFKIITQNLMGSVNDSTFWATEHLYADYREGLISMAINIPGFAFNKALKVPISTPSMDPNARKKLLGVIQSVLDEKRAMTKSGEYKGKKSMMDLLMEVEDENGQILEDEDIVDLLLTCFSVGFESSATCALWAIVHLTGHPEVLQKAKEEQEEIIKRRPSTQKGLNLKDIKQMEYLPKVIDEMLRMTNMVSFFREAKTDVQINGYTIPKGWKVLVWCGAVHMDPEIYENPQDFNPSRWGEKIKPKPGAFMPFGAGSRLCPGSDLAKLVITTFLHYVLLNYKVTRVNPESPLRYLHAPIPADNCLVEVTVIR
ncbi:Beta-amyrin 11-oxidase [Morella rubra]|uniref:Beta-amyrin 11-oxidase n=1 Tax=Morella rubra TaxID=262757 RepID=A0A6A1WFT8_9ROSI|nr:Beta-amyrin 11-oxidase [Morella rubra]